MKLFRVGVDFSRGRGSHRRQWLVKRKQVLYGAQDLDSRSTNALSLPAERAMQKVRNCFNTVPWLRYFPFTVRYQWGGAAVPGTSMLLMLYNATLQSGPVAFRMSLISVVLSPSSAIGKRRKPIYSKSFLIKSPCCIRLHTMSQQ